MRCTCTLHIIMYRSYFDFTTTLLSSSVTVVQSVSDIFTCSLMNSVCKDVLLNQSISFLMLCSSTKVLKKVVRIYSIDNHFLTTFRKVAKKVFIYRDSQSVAFNTAQNMALRAFYFIRTLTKAPTYYYMNRSQRHLLVAI